MNRIDKKYSGVIVPMITPVSANYRIDKVSAASILKTFTFSNVSVFLLGTTGESTSVLEEEKTVLVETALESAQNKVDVFAGVSSNCQEETIKISNQYAAMGVSAVVLHLPFYYPISENQMVGYFKTIADKVDCPVVLYNNPMTVKQSIPVSVVDELSYHPNIWGFKDSERGLERLDSCIELWKDRKDFSFLLGWAAQSAYALSKGCDGIVPSTGNLVPQWYKKLYTSAIEGNSTAAEHYQTLTDSVSEVYQKGRKINESIPALKVIMSEYNLCNPIPIPPMYPPSVEEERILRENIKEILTANSRVE